MGQEATDAVAEYALRLGDDALVLSQRLCEWCAAAPLLEEDIAIANVGLDYLGRARMLLQYCGERVQKTEDELAYLRDSHEFKNLLMMELPRGDFAFSSARHYLLDEFELPFFTQLTQSADARLAAIAAKTVKEITYHLRRSEGWMLRLGDGTQESNVRLQQGVDELWGYVDELFAMDDLETELVQNGVAVDRTLLRENWQQRVEQTFANANLQLPDAPWSVSGGREGKHTEHLGHMLGDMQFLQRAYPGQTW